MVMVSGARVQEHQSLVEDADAPQHFFRDLVAQNEASTSHFDGNMPTGEPWPVLHFMHRHIPDAEVQHVCQCFWQSLSNDVAVGDFS